MQTNASREITRARLFSISVEFGAFGCQMIPIEALTSETAEETGLLALRDGIKDNHWT